MAERKEELTASYQRETSVGGLITEVDFQYTMGHVAEAAALCVLPPPPPPPDPFTVLLGVL